MSVECANPLLLQWVKEWWDEARDNKRKSVLTFKKAYDSIRACPIQLTHPSEAEQLHGLGPKLCKRLTERLRMHCEVEGLPMPPHPSRARKRHLVAALGEVADDEAHMSSTQTSTSHRPRKALKPKAYVPALRSGPFAILLALSNLPPDSVATGISGFTKVQTIELAQPFCDSSFTTPSDPTKFYTAWNSMNTLLSKGLVCEFGRPTKKYALTEEGRAVAMTIRRSQGIDDGATREQDHQEFTERASRNSMQVEPVAASARTAASGRKRPADQTGMQDSQPQPEQYDWERELAKIREAQVRRFEKLHSQEPTSSPDLNSLPIPNRRNTVGPSDDLFASSHPDYRKNSFTGHRRQEPKTIELLSSSSESESSALRRRSLARPLREIPAKQINSRQTQQDSIGPLDRNRDTVKLVSGRHSSVLEPMGRTTLSAAQHLPIPPAIHQSSPTRRAQLDNTRVHIAPPGSFTVELLLDTREVRALTDRDYIQSGLLARGIRATTRALELGDALWIARLKSPSTQVTTTHHPLNSVSAALTDQQQQASATEVVLDYALERKRLDDLVASIKDGRFAEQKFRLRRWGPPNVVYLIEQFSLPAEDAQRHGPAMQSALAGIQAAEKDGWSVRRTAGLDASIAYLARMTHRLRKMYEGKELRYVDDEFCEEVGDDDVNNNNAAGEEGCSCFWTTYTGPSDTATRTADATGGGSSNNNNEHPPPPQLIRPTYPAFCARATKSQRLTLRDVYLKMLMCTQGVGADKALAVQKRWPTPRALVEALQAEKRRAGGDREAAAGDMVMKATAGLVGRRKKVTREVSRRLANVWAGRYEEDGDDIGWDGRR